MSRVVQVATLAGALVCGLMGGVCFALLGVR